MVMREPTYFLLLALAAEPLHGYAIAARARELSDERVKLTAGTLYGALDRLTDTGEVALDREEQVDGRTRRYYRLTDHGAAELRLATDRFRATVRTAESVLSARLSSAS